ncbi:MAG: DMT family transporter [Paludibacteraceae bacterium]|nr:DMT family transporter [Paludibacteraceae bacterium]MBQ7748832.1 DMT family transporter [Paludibacteraceae bacterium]MBR0497595.1 DMT family transporter [Paludibacteraceae bacterium]
MKNYTAPILTSTIWALSYVFTTIAFESFSPVQLLTLRLAIASSLLAFIGYRKGALQRISRKHIPAFVLLALLEPTGYFLCETFGLSLSSPVLASVILSTVPLFAPFIAFLTIGERFSAGNVAGLAVSFIGVLFLTLKGGSLNASPLGLLLLGGAVFFLIVYSIAVKKLQKHYTTHTIVTAQNTIGTLYFIPILLASGNPIPEHIGGSALVSAITLGIFASGLAFVWFGESIKNIGVGKTNAFLNLMPAVTAIASIAITGETVDGRGVVGIVLVIAGLFTSQAKWNFSLRKRNISAIA